MVTKIDRKLEKQLTGIAKCHSYMVEKRGNLKTQSNDSDDFPDISAWG